MRLVLIKIIHYVNNLNMSRLSKLYEAMETLRKEGLPVDENLEKKANELEENIIKKEILPVLSKTIEPALQPVKRELVLVVDYVPGQPLSVHLSRKRNFAAELTDAKEMVLDPEVTHRNHLSSSEGKIERGPARDLSVEFPDGTVISEKTAAETLVAVVQKIGVAKVRQVVEEYNLKFCKVPKSLVPASSARIGLSPLHIFDNNPKADVHRPLPRQVGFADGRCGVFRTFTPGAASYNFLLGSLFVCLFF